MLTIDGSTINLTRGDSMVATISILLPDGTAYTPAEDDVIRFRMKLNWQVHANLITKVIPHDTMQLELQPEDTADLLPGRYVWDCKLTTEDGDEDTFINAAVFILTEGGD